MGPPKLVQPSRRKTKKISVQACLRRCGGMEGGYRRCVTRRRGGLTALRAG